MPLLRLHLSRSPRSPHSPRSPRLVRAVALGALTVLASAAQADQIKVLTTGAFKQVVRAFVPAFEAQTGHRVTVDNDTAGALVKRLDGGETFDVLVLTPGPLKQYADKGRVVPAEIQNFTVYAGAVSAAPGVSPAAQAFLSLMTGAGAAETIRAKGMLPGK